MKNKAAVLIFSVLVAGIAGIPLAQADPDPNAASNTDQFVQYLIARGMDGNYVQEGRNACAALRSGQSEATVTGQLQSRLSRAESQNVVYAAHRYLCPGV